VPEVCTVRLCVIVAPVMVKEVKGTPLPTDPPKVTAPPDPALIVRVLFPSTLPNKLIFAPTELSPPFVVSNVGLFERETPPVIPITPPLVVMLPPSVTVPV
jgi:hypothetical protein